MRKIILLISPALAGLLLLASCSTTKGPQPSVALTKNQLEALGGKAKSPQIFGIVVYPSEAGPVFAGTARTHEGDVTAINFPAGEADLAPIVPVGIGGRDRVAALLDTSASQSWATLAMMGVLNVQLLAAPSLLASRPQHVFDTVGGVLGIAPHLTVDQVSVENALIQVRAASGPLGPLARGLDNANLDIVIGADLMKAFNHVQFNFPARFVTISASADYRISESNLLASVPMILSNGAVAVAGVLDGSQTNFVIDTGGDFAVALPAGRPATKLQQVSIGDLVLRDLPGTPGMDLALGQTTQPRIGRQALARFKMTLDFHTRTVHFERP